MLTFFTTLLGFGSSFAPKLLDFFQQKEDQKHELAMLAAVQAGKVEQAGIEKEQAITVAEIEEIVAAHKEQQETVKSASRWIANLSASIRPVITLLFVTEFLVINFSIAVLIWNKDGVTVENLQAMLNADFMALLAAMIAFWFGSREIRRREGRG